jgi:mannose-6-phosphate isomerase class I/predicted NBD/HSP70 family sugar kinase
MSAYPGLIMLKPVFHNNIWGGRRLAEFGYDLPDGPVGECWGIAAHPHGDCTVDGGPYDGMTLSQLWYEHHELFEGAVGDRFPLLVKVLDARENLSIQVHPDDDYAFTHEDGSLGKSECWYVLDAKEGGQIIVGQHAHDRAEFAQMVEEGRWSDLENLVPIKAGDFFDIRPGTMHAIMGGTLILETQQSSDVTYRVYDFDRRQADGSLRELHLQQAMDVIDYGAKAPTTGTVTVPEVDGVTKLMSCEYFEVLRVRVTNNWPVELQQVHPFMCLSVVAGAGGTVTTPAGTWALTKGTHFVAPHGSGTLSLTGDMTLICSYVPTAAASGWGSGDYAQTKPARGTTKNRIGIDIGGTQLRVAVYNEDGKELAKEVMPNDHDLGPAENLQRLVDVINAWDIDYMGIGVGAPGPLNFKAGKILNPPNLPGWENFNIVSFLERETKHRVRLNNDANVAGLAESLSGAGWGYESLFYFTVSTGVGGAYIYQNQVVGGANSCAAEIFNMVVNEFEDVRPGMNVGSVEEQASGPSIARIASKGLGRDVRPAEVFALCEQGDETARKVVDHAADVLAKAVHNVSCVVDPDIFVFGGSVALNNPWFIDLVREKAKSLVLNPSTLRIELAKCGGDAGLIGASLLAR